MIINDSRVIRGIMNALHRRFVGLLFVALLLAATVVSAQDVPAQVISSTDSVNFRAGPGLEYGVSRAVLTGTQVVIVDSTSVPGWFQVRLEDADS